MEIETRRRNRRNIRPSFHCTTDTDVVAAAVTVLKYIIISVRTRRPVVRAVAAAAKRIKKKKRNEYRRSDGRLFRAIAADADCRVILTLPNSISYGNGSSEVHLCVQIWPRPSPRASFRLARDTLSVRRPSSAVFPVPLASSLPRQMRIFSAARRALVSYERTIPSDSMIVSTGVAKEKSTFYPLFLATRIRISTSDVVVIRKRFWKYSIRFSRLLHSRKSIGVIVHFFLPRSSSQFS
jgi:hypothetical protein